MDFFVKTCFCKTFVHDCGNPIIMTSVTHDIKKKKTSHVTGSVSWYNNNKWYILKCIVSLNRDIHDEWTNSENAQYICWTKSSLKFNYFIDSDSYDYIFKKSSKKKRVHNTYWLNFFVSLKSCYLQSFAVYVIV